MRSCLPIGLTMAMLAAQGPNYEDRRAADVKRCEAIDPAAYQTGLIFNPDGYRSFYLQSQCFQQTAVRYRDETFCSKVRRRYALTSSSWGYSSSQCRTLVRAGVAADRKLVDEARARYRRGHVTLRDFRLALNGNGRDFDVLPTFEGAPGTPVMMTIEALPPAGAPVVIFRDGYFIDSTSTMNIYVRRDEAVQRYPPLARDARLRLRMTLTLSLPTGNGDAVWSDAFLESAFPTRERTQTLTKDVAIPPMRPPRTPR